MKKTLSWLLILLVAIFCIWKTCFADVFILLNKDTKEVVDFSPENDAVIQIGQEKIILPGKLEDYAFTDNPTNYFYKNKKFVKNIDKIDKQEQEKIKQEEIRQEEVLLQKEIKNQAIKTLKDKGIILKHLKEE